MQNHLGAFGFSGEEVFREIGTLSGGERARMALALMTLARANLLVLDEPTNHLDVENIEVLEDALDEYEGTVLLVSHDRAFLREVATRVWAFDGTRLVDFDGPFIEWEEDRARRAAKVSNPPPSLSRSALPSRAARCRRRAGQDVLDTRRRRRAVFGECATRSRRRDAR